MDSAQTVGEVRAVEAAGMKMTQSSSYSSYSQFLPTHQKVSEIDSLKKL